MRRGHVASSGTGRRSETHGAEAHTGSYGPGGTGTEPASLWGPELFPCGPVSRSNNSASEAANRDCCGSEIEPDLRSERVGTRYFGPFIPAKPGGLAIKGPEIGEGDRGW